VLLHLACCFITEPTTQKGATVKTSPGHSSPIIHINPTNPMSKQPHVLIVGAGITGVLLAQALKARNIAFSIYERDPNAHFRGPGWGLAIHWAKDTLLSLLPESLQDRLLEANVDPEGALKGECGRFPLFDLASGERLFENLSDNRIRVSRERLRSLLMTDLDVNVSGHIQASGKKLC
jgi:hypothetical protein